MYAEVATVVRIQNSRGSTSSAVAVPMARPITKSTKMTNSLVRKKGFVSLV
jgi:hypothetical protein